MKRLLLCLVLVTWLSGHVHAADNPLKHGMQFYQKHRYEDALRVLYTELFSSRPDRQKKVHLSMGIICLEVARLYRELYQVSLAVNRDYLPRLIADENQQKSHLARLYLGKTRLQTAELTESAALLAKFLTDDTVAARDKELARVDLGTLCYLRGEHQEAEGFWSKLNVADPLTATALASAYSRIGLAGKEPAAMCKNALDQVKSAGKPPTIQMINHALDVFAREGRIDDNFHLLRKANLRACFHEETLIANKAIRFYDPALLLNLAAHYGRAGLKYLEMARRASDKKVQGPATYYLCEGYEWFGSPEPARRAAEEFIAIDGMPARLKNKARVRQVVSYYLLGQKKTAEDQLQTLLKTASDPDLTAELLMACCDHRMDFPQVAIKASTLAQKGEGRPSARLNFALGRYYLWKKDYAKAVAHMEAGRDKSNKNRIEFNDPRMLIALAEAHYRSRNFSEALEIFFEMSKQYPAVRQIQAAMQGVYSMEQQSAGDAKIF